MQIDSTTGREETYGELAKKTISLAKALKNKGISCDDVVGLICYNNMEYTAAIVASIFIGAKSTAVDISSSKRNYNHHHFIFIFYIIYNSSFHNALPESIKTTYHFL